ncbi:hypothetical protein G6F22_015313 [Rhizopus arrhizus]|nr:hypothetical protein G6F22_015313 [Rhizopus arrhizus]
MQHVEHIHVGEHRAHRRQRLLPADAHVPDQRRGKPPSFPDRNTLAVMDILQSGVPYRAIAGPVAQRIAPGQPSCRDMRGGGQSRGPWAGEVVCRTIAVTDVAAVVTDDRILVVRGAEVVLVVGRRRAAVGPVQRQQARGAGSAELQAAQGAHAKDHPRVRPVPGCWNARPGHAPCG